MALNLDSMKSGGSTVERIPEGTYMGRVNSVVDLGIQPQTDYQTGAEKPSKPELLITFELPTETYTVDSDEGEVEKTRLISKRYTQSNSERSNLYRLVVTLKPGISDVSELVDEPCMISVGSTVSGNAKITDIIKPPSGMPVPEMTREGSFFDFDSPEEDLFLKQPPWVQEVIKGADNYQGFADDWKLEEESS